MSRVSKRALVNFVVDAAIAAAFVVSAVSGLVVLVPASWLAFSGSPTSALGVDYATWRTLHDWTAVIMIAGVALHTALHWKWVTMMVRRLAGGGRAGARPAVAPAPGRCAPRQTAPAESGRAWTPASNHDASAAAAAVVAPDAFAEPGSRGAASRSACREPEGASLEPAARSTLTRNAFLKGAGAVGAAALVGGLVGRAAAGAAVTWLDDGSATRVGSTTASLEQDSAGDWGSGSSDAQDSPSSPGGSGATNTTPSARVTIDAGRCTGCGACLQACPFGVFAAQGGTIVVVDESACRLCGRCTQVCRPGAIALNG